MDDFDDCLELWSDEEVVRFIGATPSSPSDTWSRLLRYGGLWKFLGYGYWAVEHRETKAYVGEIGFADFKRNLDYRYDRLPEAGWAILPAWSGQGLATEAMQAALEWLDEMNPHRGTFCMIEPANTASINTAAKLGYTPELNSEYRGNAVTLFTRPAKASNAKTSMARQ